MKKAEIFARVIKVWPEGVDALDNFSDGSIMAKSPRDTSRVYGYMGKYSHEDFGAIVTRAQWEAERERILAESIKLEEQDKEHIADLTAIACGKRSKEDQELWDKVATSALQGLMQIYWDSKELYSSADDLKKCHVDSAFEYADAFVAERAKRMKG